MNERFIMGVKVNDVNMSQAIKFAETFLVSNTLHYIVTPNPEICLKSYMNPEYTQILNCSDLSIPDGYGLKFGAFIQGQILSNIIHGVDFSEEIFKLAYRNNFKVLLIGGKGKSGTKAIENVISRYPKLNIDYMNGGKFTVLGVSEYADFIERVNNQNADIILVNLGAPKQEYFIAKNKTTLNCKLVIGVGGTIDFLSGNVKRAPKFIQNIKLEWLYRLERQPWRYGRIINAIIIFPLTVIWWRIRNVIFYRQSVVAFIINNKKEILLAKRKPRPNNKEITDQWQLPQGGVEKNHSIEKTIIREINEELGITNDNLTIVDIAKNCYKYKWDNKGKLIMPYKGQKQSLVLLKYSGDNSDIILDNIELQSYKWVNKHHIIELASPYRRQIIQIGLNKFSKYL